MGITGSYAGTAIQYVIPALLVMLGRRRVPELMVKLNCQEQLHRSPFKHAAWVWGVLGWAGLCIVAVTVNHIITGS